MYDFSKTNPWEIVKVQNRKNVPPSLALYHSGGPGVSVIRFSKLSKESFLYVVGAALYWNLTSENLEY